MVVMGLSAFKVYKGLQTYSSNQDQYENISRDAVKESSVDFDALKKTNPDIKAWIKYEDTKMDYPIVQGKDNDKYLHIMFDGTESPFGTLFVDYKTEKAFEQFNTLVFGHHMKDGSMFGSLKNLKKKKYAEKHPEFQLSLPNGDYHLYIWAFLNPADDDKVYLTNLKTLREKKAYLKHVREEALYLMDFDVTETDTLVVLSTCAYEYEGARYVVVCKMMPVTVVEEGLENLQED